MILFTSDIDWAPEEVIKDMLNIFELYKIECTLFCTHSSKVLENCNPKLFELGIHPNFNDSLLSGIGKSAEETIDDILKLYPEAKGVRSHSTTQSSPLLNLFRNKGLLYESNQLLPYNWNIEPYDCWTGLKRIPYNWEDDTHFAYKKSYDFDIVKYNLDKNFLILDFHPIHVYLNTDSQKTYDEAKKYYHNPKELLRLRNKTNIGTRDFLKSTLERVSDQNIETKKMGELI